MLQLLNTYTRTHRHTQTSVPVEVVLQCDSITRVLLRLSGDNLTIIAMCPRQRDIPREHELHVHVNDRVAS